MNKLTFNPGELTLAQLEEIYRNPCDVAFNRECRSNVETASKVVKQAAAGDAAVYGINTGFGKLANTRIPPEQTATLQRNLILSHCCGVGSSLPDGVVRLVLLLKLNSLARGASGISWDKLELLEAMLNNSVLPVIPAKGSVGASGDLAPLAHMTAAMIGEGEVSVQGKIVEAREGLSLFDLNPVELGPKEGLAMINGTQVSTALALAGLFDTWRLCQSALITGAIASDALMASTAPFRPEIHELRNHQGQISAARALRALLDGSEIRESHREDDERVQDPYCYRCQPQVMGACLDQLMHVGRTLETESNAVTDNPLVVNKTGDILSGGNFHAEPVAFAADLIAIAIAETGSISERRIATLLDPALNYKLPAFLSPDPGLNSGLMVPEITAAALMSENKQRAALCSIDSTPTSANQEDHVSMACHAAYRLIDMNRNLAYIIAVELLTGCQGVEFRAPEKTSIPLQNIVSSLRQKVSRLEQDRLLAPDMESAKELVMSGELVEIAGKELLPAL